MSELVAGVLQGLAGLNVTALYVLAGLFTALESSVGIGLLIPGDSVVLLAGTTATTPHWFTALVAAATLGSLTAESVGYLLGRRYGARLRTGRLGPRLGEDRWAAAEAFLRGRGGRAVAAARFVAVVHALVPVLAGTVGMPYRRLVGWGAVGAAAWSLLYVAIGAVAGASWRHYGDQMGLAGLAMLGAALAVVLAVRAARSRAQQLPAGGALAGNRVEPITGGRNERHDTAA
jgi:membrane-associated protein